MYYALDPFPLVSGIGAELGENRVVKTYKVRREGDDDNFKQLYRFTRENVDYLARTFLPSHEETRGGALLNSHKIKCFLRYVGDPGFQVGVGEDLIKMTSSSTSTVWSSKSTP